MTDASIDASPITTFLDEFTARVERAVAHSVLRGLIALAEDAREPAHQRG
jgi:hypothetical protein